MVTKQNLTSTRYGDPPALHVHAINDLRFIRETMERAASFTAVPGWGMVTMGSTALFTALLAATRADPWEWLILWIREAVVAIVIGSLTMGYKARRAQIALFSGPGWRFILNLCVPILAAVPLTAVLCLHGLVGMLPGLWLLLYGVGVVTGGAFAVRVIPLMGFCFIGAGIAALFSPSAWGNIFLALGFGGFHLVFGAIVAWRHGG